MSGLVSILLATFLFTSIAALLATTVLLMRSWLLQQKPVELIINGSETLSVLSGNKLLETLQESGYNIPSTCAGAGTCGLCKVKVAAGGGEILPTERAKLNAAEIDTGVRLSCQLTIDNDLSVEFSDAQVEEWQCRIKSTRNLSPLIKEIAFELPANSNFDFTPGAYATVTAPAYQYQFSDMPIDPAYRASWNSLGIDHLTASTDEPVTRAYSIASTLKDQNTLVLLVRLALPPPDHRRDWPPGVVSSWLFSLVPGDQVPVQAPFGDFKVQDNNRDIVLIGGGVGMAPLRSIAHHQLSINTDRKIRFFYGACTTDDLLYKEEFDQLAEKYPSFDWTVALSDPQKGDNWNGATGFIHEIVEKQFMQVINDTDQCDYYLCGPPLMLRATFAMLQKAGVPSNQIFADDFGS